MTGWKEHIVNTEEKGFIPSLLGGGGHQLCAIWVMQGQDHPGAQSLHTDSYRAGCSRRALKGEILPSHHRKAIFAHQMAPQGTFFWVAPFSTTALTANSPLPPSPTNFSRSFQTTVTEMLKLSSYRTKPYRLLQVFYVKNNQRVEKQALKAGSGLNQTQMRSLWRSPEEWVNSDVPKLQSASMCRNQCFLVFFFNKTNGVCRR